MTLDITFFEDNSQVLYSYSLQTIYRMFNLKLSPLKPSSSVEFINFYPKCYSPVQHLFPSGLKHIKVKGGLKPSRTLWDLPMHESLCSQFLVCKKKAFSLWDPPWVPKGRFKQLIKRVRECRDISAEMGQGPGSSWGDVCNNQIEISEFFYGNLGPSPGRPW